jgi:integrase/recombinase XerD
MPNGLQGWGHFAAKMVPFFAATDTSIVCRTLARAGINDAPSRGAHMLRHSAATSLLRAGMPLAAIGAVLRHRSIDTTAQYAKVDTPSLKRIAQPWPGGASC